MSLSDRILGTAILIVTGISLIGTRAIAALLPLLGVMVLHFAFAERRSVPLNLRLVPITVVICVLLIYALASTTWGPAPGNAMPHLLAAIVMVGSAHVISTWIGQQDEARVRHLVFWLVIGFAGGLAWLAVEIVTDQAIKRWIIEAFEFLKPVDANKHYSFDKHGNVKLVSSDLNRNIAAVNLLLWPIVMCAVLLWKGPLRLFIIGTILTTAIIATFISDHETSKLALVASLTIYLLARQWPGAAKAAIGAGWIVAVLGTLPLVLYAYSGLELHKADWLQNSGRQRIAIWADIGKRTLDTPILGVGARTTYTLNALSTRSLTQLDTQEKVTIGRHPHNVFLQTWFELGGIGALLLLLAGGVVFIRLMGAPTFALPFALATAAALILELGLCWDIWQRWFFALLSFLAAIAAMTLRFVSMQTQCELEHASE